MQEQLETHAIVYTQLSTGKALELFWVGSLGCYIWAVLFCPDPHWMQTNAGDSFGGSTSWILCTCNMFTLVSGSLWLTILWMARWLCCECDFGSFCNSIRPMTLTHCKTHKYHLGAVRRSFSNKLMPFTFGIFGIPRLQTCLRLLALGRPDLCHSATMPCGQSSRPRRELWSLGEARAQNSAIDLCCKLCHLQTPARVAVLLILHPPSRELSWQSRWPLLWKEIQNAVKTWLGTPQKVSKVLFLFVFFVWTFEHRSQRWVILDFSFDVCISCIMYADEHAMPLISYSHSVRILKDGFDSRAYIDLYSTNIYEWPFIYFLCDCK